MTLPSTNYSLVENFVQLACCVEEINARISASPVHQRWHWNSRRNTAVFLLNRLADQVSVNQQKMNLPRLSREQRRQIAEKHSLLNPIEPHSIERIESTWSPDERLKSLITQLHES